MLINFRHGLGDAAQFTRSSCAPSPSTAELDVDVFSLQGKHSAFAGLCAAPLARPRPQPQRCELRARVRRRLARGGSRCTSTCRPPKSPAVSSKSWKSPLIRRCTATPFRSIRRPPHGQTNISNRFAAAPPTTTGDSLYCCCITRGTHRSGRRISVTNRPRGFATRRRPPG